jgi:hypothetical protein
LVFLTVFSLFAAGVLVAFLPPRSPPGRRPAAAVVTGGGDPVHTALWEGGGPEGGALREAGAGRLRFLTLNPGESVDFSFLKAGGEPVVLKHSPRLLERIGNSLRFRARKAGYGALSASAGRRQWTVYLFVSPIPSRHVEREDRDWYRTQYGTGLANCGPALISMAILWARGTDVPVEQIRAEIGYPYADGSLSFDDLRDSLGDHGVKARYFLLTSAEDLVGILEGRHLGLVLIQSGGIQRAMGDPRENPFGRYYDDNIGHYVLVKGYSLDRRYFVVYDPLPSDWDFNGLRYADGTSMIGKNRYYRAEELFSALKTPQILEVSSD